MSRTLGATLAAAFLLCFAAAAGAQTSRNFNQLANVDAYGSNYSSCCTYVHQDGREYAAIGTQTGTAIYNITSPAAPALVGFITGPTSIWREMQSYRNWIYVVSEGTGTGRGLQIIRMTDPEHPVLAKTYTATFTTSHTVTIDTTRALLYANGTGTGMHQMSLANPENPVDVGVWTTFYVHDFRTLGNRGYASCINDGKEVVLDLNTPGVFSQLASWVTPNAFTHNSWVTPDSHYVYCTDETSSPAGTLSFYDISNLADVKYLGQYTGLPNDIVHNVHGKGDTLFIAYYTAGMRAFDIHDPEVPIEVGFLDTSPVLGPAFNGMWGVDARLPSGVVIGSDIESGLFVTRPALSYGTVSGVVRDGETNAPLPGVTVTVVELAKSMVSYPTTGKYGFSPTTPGTYTLHVEAFGYVTTDVQVAVVNGVHLVQDIVLNPVQSITLSGIVTKASDGSPLQYATVSVGGTSLVGSSDAAGHYSITRVPVGSYAVTGELPGYIAVTTPLEVTGPGTDTRDFPLIPATWFDNAETDRGWTLGVPGDNATTGQWIRANPVGTNGGRGQNEDDHGPAPADSICFVTGNGTVGGSVGAADVDNGKTTLLSPRLDMSALTEPRLVWWQWFYNQSSSGNDTLATDISNDNGRTWKRVQGVNVSQPSWTRVQIRVQDFLAPTDSMRVRFVAADLAPGGIVEASVDDIEYFSATAVTAVREPGTASRGVLQVSAAGLAPSSGVSQVRFRVERRVPVAAQVFDMTGRLVRSFGVETRAAGPQVLRWDGRDAAGRAVAAGVYTVRLSAPGTSASARVVRLD